MGRPDLIKINGIHSGVTIPYREPYLTVPWCFWDTISQPKSPLYLSYKQEMTLLKMFAQFAFKSKHLKGGSVSAVQRSQNLGCRGANSRL